MADTRISNLLQANTLGDSDLLTTVQGGINKKLPGLNAKISFYNYFLAQSSPSIIGTPVADIAALKAIDTTAYISGTSRTVYGLGSWQFIQGSTATADDITVVAPTVGTGRWIKQTIIEADGSLKLLKDLNANSKAIKSVLDPVDPQDAATKSWVESHIVVENLFDRIFEGSGYKLSQHNALDNLDFSSASGYIKFPIGTILERPTPTNGMARYNLTTGLFEFYQGDAWVNYLTDAAENLWDRVVEGLGFTLRQHTVTDNVDLSAAKGYIKIPTGLTAERPTGANGMIRYNSTTGRIEFYENSDWQNYLTAAALSLFDRVADGAGFKLIQHNIADNIDFSSATGYMKLPSGTDGQRLTPSNGVFRYNTTSNVFEFYQNGAWVTYLTDAAENLWDRVGSTLQPHTANDNVNIGSGTFTGASMTGNIITDSLTEKTLGNGIIVPTGIFLKQQTYTAPTADVHYVPKKYADDLFATGLIEHDYWTPAHTPITPGQTIFTLSISAVGPSKSILTWNGVQQEYGVQYTISGTTLTWLGATLTPANSIEVWYNINTSGYIQKLDEKQIYYVNDNGDDSNNGKSINTPVKTIGQAITLVNAQSPSSSNQFEIQIIGSGIYTENFTLPVYTTLKGDSATVTGVINLGSHSKIDVKTINIPNSTSTGITATSAVDVHLKCNTFLPGTGVSTGVLATTNSTLYVEIGNLTANANFNLFGAASSSKIYAKGKNLDVSASGSSIASCVINSNIYVTGENILQNSSSYHDSTSQYYITANNYEKSPFVARAIVDVTNFCGDNGTYVVPLAYTTEYNGEVMNKGAYYNTSTYKVSYPFNCLVDFKASILLKNITAAAHTYGELAIMVYNASDVLQQAYILDLKNINNTAGASPIAPSNALILNGASDVVMPAGYYAQLVVLVEGSTKEITLNGSSLAASRFSGTIKQIL